MSEDIKLDRLLLGMPVMLIFFVFFGHIYQIFVWKTSQLNVGLSLFILYLSHEFFAFGFYLILMNDKLVDILSESKKMQMLLLILGGLMGLVATFRWSGSLPPYFGYHYVLYVILFWSMIAVSLAVKGILFRSSVSKDYTITKNSTITLWDLASIIMGGVFVYYMIDVFMIMKAVGVI